MAEHYLALLQLAGHVTEAVLDIFDRLTDENDEDAETADGEEGGTDAHDR